MAALGGGAVSCERGTPVGYMQGEAEVPGCRLNRGRLVHVHASS